MLNLDTIIFNKKGEAMGELVDRVLARRPAAMVLAVFFCLFMGAFPALAGEKGAMEIGLSWHYPMAQGDASELESGMAYGAMFQYWLNSTSTIVVGLDHLSFEVPFTLDGEDVGGTYVSNVIHFGLRYRPELDLWIRPYAEAGLGIQFWNLEYDAAYVDRGGGGSIAYWAGAGLEYEFLEDFALGLNARYYYTPLDDNMEYAAETMPSRDKFFIHRDELKSVGFFEAGVEITWKFK